MCVLWKFIAILVLAVVGLCPQSSRSQTNTGNNSISFDSAASEQHKLVPLDEEGQPFQLLRQHREGATRTAAANSRTKRETDDSVSLWEWLTGRDKPNRCVMVSVGGVIGGGALTGAFVGAGIGSIFTGPAAIVGALVGGVVGIFGGISVGHRAGAAACDSACGTDVNCYPYN